MPGGQSYRKSYRDPVRCVLVMAEQTTSSILIQAAPDAVMAVIADFASYPLWVKGMKVAKAIGSGPDGRAERVHFVLDVPPIKDDYTLAYTWDGDRDLGPLTARLDELATFLDLRAVQVEDRGDLARTLRRATAS